jgi:inosose dehydratase
VGRAATDLSGARGAVMDRQKVKLGITPTLWWNDDFPLIDAGITFGQCVSEMALAGFEGCSIGHKYPTDGAVLKLELDRRGLQISEPWASTYFTIEAMERQTLDGFSETLHFIKALGCTDMVVAELGAAVHQQPVALFANRPQLDDRQWDALTTGLDRLGEMANAEGMNLCYHHHMGTGVMFRPDVDRLMESTDPSLVHLLLDTGHIAFAGDDPLALAEAHGDRIKHIHLKDVRRDVVDRVRAEDLSFQDGIEAGVFTVPGDGDLDLAPVLEALARHGFEGWLVVEAEQDPAKANPLEHALMARSYLRDVLGW